MIFHVNFTFLFPKELQGNQSMDLNTDDYSEDLKYSNDGYASAFR